MPSQILHLTTVKKYYLRLKISVKQQSLIAFYNVLVCTFSAPLETCINGVRIEVPQSWSQLFLIFIKHPTPLCKSALCCHVHSLTPEPLHLCSWIALVFLMESHWGRCLVVMQAEISDVMKFLMISSSYCSVFLCDAYERDFSIYVCRSPCPPSLPFLLLLIWNCPTLSSRACFGRQLCISHFALFVLLQEMTTVGELMSLT